MGKRGHLDKGEEGGGGRRWLILLCQIFPNLHTRQVISLPQIRGKRILSRFPTSRKITHLCAATTKLLFFWEKDLCTCIVHTIEKKTFSPPLPFLGRHMFEYKITFPSFPCFERVFNIVVCLSKLLDAFKGSFSLL